MAADVRSKSQAIAIWALRVVLGLVFLYVGTTKLTGTGNTVDYFAAIGWGQWFRYLTGLLEMAGVALLFVSRAVQLVPVSAVTCPCVWRQEASVVRRFGIPRYNRENGGYIESIRASSAYSTESKVWSR